MMHVDVDVDVGMDVMETRGGKWRDIMYTKIFFS